MYGQPQYHTAVRLAEKAYQCERLANNEHQQIADIENHLSRRVVVPFVVVASH